MQGPCRQGQIVTFNAAGGLVCSQKVRLQKATRWRQDVVIGDHTQPLYYPLGSSGPCPNSSLLDFDVFQLKAKCSDPNSFKEVDEELDSIYNHLYPEYDFYPVTLIYGDDREQLSHRKGPPMHNNVLQPYWSYEMRNDLIPLPDQLLNPCRPGKRNRNNFKCTNSFL